MDFRWWSGSRSTFFSPSPISQHFPTGPIPQYLAMLPFTLRCKYLSSQDKRPASVRTVFLCVSLYKRLKRKRESVGMKREGTRQREGKSKQDESPKGEGEMKLALKKKRPDRRSSAMPNIPDDKSKHALLEKSTTNIQLRKACNH